MAINKKLIHINSFEDFNSRRLSANAGNTMYTLGVEGAPAPVSTSTPLDIKYHSIVFIKDTQQIWTHGQLYDCSNEVNFGIGDGLYLSEAQNRDEVDLIEVLLSEGTIKFKDVVEDGEYKGKGLYTNAEIIPALGAKINGEEIDGNLWFNGLKAGHSYIIVWNDGVNFSEHIGQPTGAISIEDYSTYDGVKFTVDEDCDVACEGDFSIYTPYLLEGDTTVQRCLNDLYEKLNIVNPYSIGDGLELENNVISVLPADDSITVSASGISTSAALLKMRNYFEVVDSEGHARWFKLKVPEYLVGEPSTIYLDLEYTPWIFSQLELEQRAGENAEHIFPNSGFDAIDLSYPITTLYFSNTPEYIETFYVGAGLYIETSVEEAINLLNFAPEKEFGDGLYEEENIVTVNPADGSISVSSDGISTSAELIPYKTIAKYTQLIPDSTYNNTNYPDIRKYPLETASYSIRWNKNRTAPGTGSSASSGVTLRITGTKTDDVYTYAEGTAFAKTLYWEYPDGLEFYLGEEDLTVKDALDSLESATPYIIGDGISEDEDHTIYIQSDGSINVDEDEISTEASIIPAVKYTTYRTNAPSISSISSSVLLVVDFPANSVEERVFINKRINYIANYNTIPVQDPGTNSTFITGVKPEYYAMGLPTSGRNEGDTNRLFIRLSGEDLTNEGFPLNSFADSNFLTENIICEYSVITNSDVLTELNRLSNEVQSGATLNYGLGLEKGLDEVLQVKVKPNGGITLDDDGISTHASIISANATSALRKYVDPSGTTATNNLVRLTFSGLIPNKLYTISILCTPINDGSYYWGSAVAGLGTTPVSINGGEEFSAIMQYTPSESSGSTIVVQLFSYNSGLHDILTYDDLLYLPSKYSIESKISGSISGEFYVQSLLSGGTGGGSATMSVGNGLKLDTTTGSMMTDIDAISQLSPVITSLQIAGDFNLAGYSDSKQILINGEPNPDDSVFSLVRAKSAKYPYILPQIIHVRDGSTVRLLDGNPGDVIIKQLLDSTLKKGAQLKEITGGNTIGTTFFTFTEDMYVIVESKSYTTDVNIEFRNILGRTLAELQTVLSGGGTDGAQAVTVARCTLEEAKGKSQGNFETIYFCTDANYIYYGGSAYGSGDRLFNPTGSTTIFRSSYANRHFTFDTSTPTPSENTLRQKIAISDNLTDLSGNISNVADYLPAIMTNTPGNAFLIDKRGILYSPYRTRSLSSQAIPDVMLAAATTNNNTATTRMNAMRDYMKDFLSSANSMHIVKTTILGIETSSESYYNCGVDYLDGPSTQMSTYGGKIDPEDWANTVLHMEFRIPDRTHDIIRGIGNTVPSAQNNQNILSFGTDSSLNTTTGTYNVHLIYPYAGSKYLLGVTLWANNSSTTQAFTVGTLAADNPLDVQLTNVGTGEVADPKIEVDFGITGGIPYIIVNGVTSTLENLSVAMGSAISHGGLYMGSMYGNNRLVWPIDYDISLQSN